MKTPTVNITVVTFNRLRLTRACLDSLLPWLAGRSTVTLQVVDNGSEDGTQDFLRLKAEAYPMMRVVTLRRNMGVSVAANLGWASQNADYYVKFDNDVVIRDPDWLDPLISLAERNQEVGMIAYQFCSWHKTKPVNLPSGDRFIESDCCGGACVLIPRQVHERFGFWNEDYGRYGFEDLEYGARVMQGGLRIGYVDAQGRVEHLGYEPNVLDAAHEAAKSANIESDEKGKKLYVLNKFMFESGVRPLYVGRKYLPVEGTEPVRFRSNPDYQSVLRLHDAYLPLVDFHEGEDGVRIDLTRLRQQEMNMDE